MKGLVLAAALLFAATPAGAAPRLEPLPGGGRIMVSYEAGLESTAREIQAGAESELERIADDLVDLPIPRTVRIKLVLDAKDLGSIVTGAPPWAIGIADPGSGVIGIAMRRGAVVVDPMSTMRHELGHIALGAAIGDRAPHWLHEGFAYQHSAEWSWDRSETLAGMVWFGGVIELDDLDQSFPAEESPANRAYAESYDFVGYLSRRGRWEDPDDDGDRWPFRRFLTRVGHGATLDVAAMKEFGKPIHALFDEWREELQKRYLTAPIGLFGMGVWILCALLLTLAFLRRRRYNKRRLAQWDRDERAHDAEVARLRPIIVPPYVPWPGDDPFAEIEDDPPADESKIVN